MAVTLKVREIQKIDVQADNSTQLDAICELREGETLIEERRLSFPLGTTQAQLKEELTKFLETYNADRDLAAKNAELDAQHAQADETIAELSGFELTLDENVGVSDEVQAEVDEEPQTTEPVTEEQPAQ